MINKLKYFGIFENCFKFNELTDDEQKMCLIKHKVYIEGKNEIIYNEDLVHPFYLNKSNDINFIGKDFTINRINYTLNPQFIDEVYVTILDTFENGYMKNINDYIEVLNLSYQTIEDENERINFLKDNKKLANQDYLKQLSNKIFQDFNRQKKNDKNYKEYVIKKHLRFDIKHLSDYVFGLDNRSSFLTIREYGSFLRIERILQFCDNLSLRNSETESKRNDTSLQVLLLEEIIVLGTKWEELNPTSKSKILCHLFGKNKDNIRDVYYEISKPQTTYSKKILKDMKTAADLIKKITG